MLLNFVPMTDDDTRRTRLEEGMKELEVRRGGPAPLAQPLQEALLGAVFPLSQGQLVRLARENEASALLVSLLSTAAGEWDADVAALHTLMDRFAERGPAGPFTEHPAFGQLNGRMWGVLTWRHLDHHLRQFGV